LLCKLRPDMDTLLCSIVLEWVQKNTNNIYWRGMRTVFRISNNGLAHFLYDQTWICRLASDIFLYSHTARYARFLTTVRVRTTVRKYLTSHFSPFNSYIVVRKYIILFSNAKRDREDTGSASGIKISQYARSYITAGLV